MRAHRTITPAGCFWLAYAAVLLATAAGCATPPPTTADLPPAPGLLCYVGHDLVAVGHALNFVDLAAGRVAGFHIRALRQAGPISAIWFVPATSLQGCHS